MLGHREAALPQAHCQGRGSRGPAALRRAAVAETGAWPQYFFHGQALLAGAPRPRGLDTGLKRHFVAFASHLASRSLLPWLSPSVQGFPLASRKDDMHAGAHREGGTFMCRVCSGSLTIHTGP